MYLSADSRWVEGKIAMGWALRNANIQDAVDLARIIERSLGDIVDTAHIEAVLADSTRVSIVGESDGHVAGFAHGFLTQSAEGLRRWELDLLAVAPEMRGKGLGRALVEACTCEGWRLNARMARALIAADNFASQRAFAAAGYHCQTLVHGLFVAHGSARNLPVAQPENPQLIPVRTLTYEGVWLEGALTHDLVSAALAIAPLAGAVIPMNDDDQRALLVNCGFRLIGEYQWWLRAP